MFRGAESRSPRISSHEDLKRWMSVHDFQVGFQFNLQSVQIVCSSYEDPNVDDMKPSSNNRDGSEDRWKLFYKYSS